MTKPEWYGAATEAAAQAAQAARANGAPPDVVERSAKRSAVEVAEWWPGTAPDPRTGEVA